MAGSLECAFLRSIRKRTPRNLQECRACCASQKRWIDRADGMTCKDETSVAAVVSLPGIDFE